MLSRSVSISYCMLCKLQSLDLIGHVVKVEVSERREKEVRLTQGKRGRSSISTITDHKFNCVDYILIIKNKNEDFESQKDHMMKDVHYISRSA